MSKLNIDSLTDAIERLHSVTFEVWEGENNTPTWDYVEEAIDDVCARLLLRYADRREAEATAD